MEAEVADLLPEVRRSVILFDVFIHGGLAEQDHGAVWTGQVVLAAVDKKHVPPLVLRRAAPGQATN